MKETKDIKVQIRISATEKRMIDDLKKDINFSISDFFRKSLYDYYKSNRSNHPK
jgi:hypothetical protein